jgi:hypothetical protein
MNYYAEGGQAMAAPVQEMPPSQIITADLGRTMPPEELGQLFNNLSALTDEGKVFILQENNTIIVLISIANEVAEVHLFSVDEPLITARSIKVMLDELNRSHLKRIYGNVDNEDTPKMLALMNSFGMQVEQSDNPEYVWMANI